MAKRVSYPLFKAFTTAGALASGYKLYSYDAGTSTPRTTYQDEDGLVPHTNPVILNALGEADVFLDGSTKLTLTDADDVVQTGWPVDNIDPTSVTAAEVSYVPSGDLTSTNVQDALDEIKTDLDGKADDGDLMGSPPDGVFITGNINGLDFNINSSSPTDTVDVLKGNCLDSDNSTLLTLAADTTAVIGSPVANTLYHLFLCFDGTSTTAQFDTDIDGSTLLGGTITKLRWIGFILTNASGNIYLFTMNRNTMIFGDFDEVKQGSGLNSTSYVQLDFTYLPLTRIEGGHICFPSDSSNTENIAISIDGTTALEHIVTSPTGAVQIMNTSANSVKLSDIWYRFYGSVVTCGYGVTEITLKR